jgi:uncharacterized ferredoxin-like protein
MAKSYHSKEVTENEMVEAAGKSIASWKRTSLKAKTIGFLFGTKIIRNELTLWKIALQIESFASHQSNQERAVVVVDSKTFAMGKNFAFD